MFMPMEKKWTENDIVHWISSVALHSIFCACQVLIPLMSIYVALLKSEFSDSAI